MSVYYVSHPEFPLKAKVDAPSTDKARTTYLDYLERTGSVARRFRQSMRKGIATKRLVDSEEITADVNLDYEYGDIEQAPTLESIPQVEGAQQMTPAPTPEVSVQPSSPLAALKEASYRQTPIAQAFLRSMGVS